MVEPKSSHPYWPDALTKPTDSAALKPWSWALERLESLTIIGLQLPAPTGSRI